MSRESSFVEWMRQRTSARSYIRPSLGSKMNFSSSTPIPLNILPQGRVNCLCFLLYPQLICSCQFLFLEPKAMTRCLVQVCSSRVGYAVTSLLTMNTQRRNLVSQHQASLCHCVLPLPFARFINTIFFSSQQGATNQLNAENKSGEGQTGVSPCRHSVSTKQNTLFG